MDPIHSLLDSLEQTQGDSRAQAVVTAEFLVMARPEGERQSICAAVDAAAVLRWFNADLLARVLELSGDDARSRFATLKMFPFVEHYRRGQTEVHNLQQSTRLGWRTKIATENPPRFRALCDRASLCFADDPRPASRIEWVYHLLCGDPELGASELERVGREWPITGRPEDYYALIAALRELEGTNVIGGRARAWTLLVIGWGHVGRGETTQLMELAENALSLARDCGDQAAEADATCLKGDAWQSQGNLNAAQSEFEKYEAISRRLVELDSGNASRQWNLAVALSRLGGALYAKGKQKLAWERLRESLEISRRLAGQDPSNATWQHGLALAQSRVGDLLEAEGKLDAARDAFEQSVAIIHRLTYRDPSNVGWQRELALAHGRVGRILRAESKLKDARRACEESLNISRRLADQDPTDAARQRDLALAYSRLGDVLQEQSRLDSTGGVLQEQQASRSRLAHEDPSSVGGQRRFLAASSRAGAVLQDAATLDAAQRAFEGSLAINRRLAGEHPSDAGLQLAVAAVLRSISEVLHDRGQSDAASRAFDEFNMINRGLGGRDVGGWQRDFPVDEISGPLQLGAGRDTRLQIFISYASEDVVLAKAINSELRGVFSPGVIKTIVDTELKLGVAWRESLDRELNSADILLIVATGQEKLAHSFTGFEVGYFSASIKQRAGMTYFDSKRLIIPIAISGDVPATVANVQGLKLDDQLMPLVMQPEARRKRQGLVHKIPYGDREDPIVRLFMRLQEIIRTSKYHRYSDEEVEVFERRTKDSCKRLHQRILEELQKRTVDATSGERRIKPSRKRPRARAVPRSRPGRN